MTTPTERLLHEPLPSPRAFVCIRCNRRRLVETTTGPLPSVCDACDPVGAARRALARESARARADRMAAHARITSELLDRARGRGNRAGVGAAARAVAAAEGAAATREALLDLSAAALAWADALQPRSGGRGH